MAINNSGWHRLASKLEADLKEDLMEFLEENPNPADTAVHEWAEERGYEVDDIEEVVYEIATDHVQMGEDSEDEDDSEDDDDEDSEEEEWEDEVEGGLADDKEPGDYDLDQLLKGIEVEFEHTDKPELALEIAMDHLEEQDDYYDELAKMESGSKSKEAKMKLKGISPEGMNRIARKVKAQGELDEVAPGLADDSWDMGGDPGDNRDEEWMPDAEELVLYIDNTYELYGQKQSIQKNLIRKLNKGNYDASLAPKLWGYLVQAGAKRYVQEMGDSFQGMPWYKVFPPQTRQEAAQMMAADFEDEVDVAEGDLNEHFGV